MDDLLIKIRGTQKLYYTDDDNWRLLMVGYNQMKNRNWNEICEENEIVHIRNDGNTFALSPLMKKTSNEFSWITRAKKNVVETFIPQPKHILKITKPIEENYILKNTKPIEESTPSVRFSKIPVSASAFGTVRSRPAKERKRNVKQRPELMPFLQAINKSGI
uniref:Bro-N domain-containing protein n=1 Tax=Rhabditophanes sp. KR3021 TaxID=114890 RepID=A0AC35UDC4_9BILA